MACNKIVSQNPKKNKNYYKQNKKTQFPKIISFLLSDFGLKYFLYIYLQYEMR